MTFYARSENQSGEKETVIEHLKKVGEYCEKNASHFGKGFEGRIAGQFHDFGKMSNRFQEVLNGMETKVNHEMAGACAVRKKYGKSSSLEIQIAIYSHHKGLDFALQDYVEQYFNPDYLDPQGRKMSIKNLEEFGSSYRLFAEGIKDNNEKVNLPIYNCCNNPHIEQMLAIRMLYSALVDADYTASAEHYDSHDDTKMAETSFQPKVWLDSLFSLLDRIKQTSTANDKVNDLRDKVLEDCLLTAQNPPGLFTLTAPTGMGKTLALLAFALAHAQQYHKRRIIIVLPYLSIIEQSAKQYRQINSSLLEDHSQTEFNEQSRLYADHWHADLIITTSVKFFESLFQNMPTDCRKIHSISNSVIIFDEAQCLPHNLIGATLETMNALCSKYQSTVVFSSATQPMFSYRKDLDWNPTEIIRPETSNLFQSQGTKRVHVHWEVNQKISFLELATKMSQSRSCCTIVNMKKHSANLFRELQLVCSSEGDSLYHISTDMCIAHRKAVLKEINHRLEHQMPCRLVSTQCIEAGVDLDFDQLYRALAPLEAIIQSAGRCNRNGRLSQGDVTVFIPEEEKYPDAAYENAANIVKLLLKELDLDIYHPEHIKEYYKNLYQTVDQDKSDLRQAINNLDFEGVSKAYQLIPSKGYTVIVPYQEKMDLFHELCVQAREEGLSPLLMKKARPITVNVYHNNIKDVGEQLFFKPTRARQPKSLSNWFILLDKTLYHEKTGLQLEKSEFLNTII